MLARTENKSENEMMFDSFKKITAVKQGLIQDRHSLQGGDDVTCLDWKIFCPCHHCHVWQCHDRHKYNPSLVLATTYY